MSDNSHIGEAYFLLWFWIDTALRTYEPKFACEEIRRIIDQHKHKVRKGEITIPSDLIGEQYKIQGKHGNGEWYDATPYRSDSGFSGFNHPEEAQQALEDMRANKDEMYWNELRIVKKETYQTVL